MIEITRRPAWAALIVMTLFGLVGCGAGESRSAPGGEAGAAASAASPAAGAVITYPADGDTLAADSVVIRMGTRGVEIRPAGTEEPGTGHLHLFVDRDPTPLGEVIPSGAGIVHLGGGQTEHVLGDLAPGAHTVVAVLGDYRHVRMAVATDTVRFFVR